VITEDCVNEVEHPAAWFAMAKAATEILDDIFFVKMAYYMSIFGLGTPTRSRSHVQAGSGEHMNEGLLCQQQPRPGESLVRNVVQV